MTRLTTRTLIVVVLAASGCWIGTAVAGDPPPATAAEQLGVPAGAAYVGSASCLECHEEIGEFFTGSPHHPDRGFTVPGTSIGSCEACHGPGSRHIAEGDGSHILGADRLAALDQDQRAGLCLQCHREKESSWYAGDHAGTTTSCADCHTDQAHFAAGGVRPRADFRVKGEFCLQCHTDQQWRFRLQYHHPVLEGQIDCVDCHAPHEDVETAVTFGSEENRACFVCHGELGGPFVFEHDAVQTESCSVCHDAHGSPNDRLLRQDDNSLCMRCHFAPAYPVIGEVDHQDYLGQRARCYDCHAEIHGSNLDQHYLKP